MVFSFIYTIIEKGILGDHPTYPSTGNPYIFDPISSTVFALILGLIIGIFEILFLEKWFRKYSLLKKIFLKTVILMILTTLFITGLTIIGHAFEMKLSPIDDRVLEYCSIFLSSFAFWTLILYASAGFGICLFYTEISDNIGQGVLLNFFTGKYHHPLVEKRIFMFIDMKSSTTIAEKLGHVQYFLLLKEYFSDLSDSILQYGGEIYQYVGDEIIISWKYENTLMNNNALLCFYSMKANLSSQSEKYKVKFGIAPTFKAGIHLGKVTTGEIGKIKREIVFSGDVLNTTARIQGLCNDYNVDLLASEKLINTLELGSKFQSKALGKTELRGRDQKIRLFTIEQI